jgi:ribosomal protein L24
MKKLDRVKVLEGRRKGEIGYVLTAIVSEGEETIVVEFENEDVETFDFVELEIISA